MVQLTLHQPILGKNPGDTVDLTAEDAEWYLQNGYVSKVRGTEDELFGKLATSSDAKSDPTLAENREKPAPSTPHIANGDDTPVTSDQLVIETTPTGKAARKQEENDQPSGATTKGVPTPDKPKIPATAPRK